MNTIKIYLAESGRIADLHKDFPLYQYQYQNKLLNVFVPTSILAPQFTTLSDEGQTLSEYVAGTAVKIGMRYLTRSGEIKVSQSSYLRYLKTLTYQNVEYALFERKLPKEFTLYAGQGQNAPTLVINVVNIETDVEPAETLSIIPSQTCSLDVMPSSNLDNDEPIEPSELETINGRLNAIDETLAEKQDKVDESIQLTTDSDDNPTWQDSQSVVGAINNNTAQNELNKTNIQTNTEDIAQNKSDIEYLYEHFAQPEEYIGQMTGSSLPTEAQLTQFVEDTAGREPKNADVIIFVLQVAGGTDKNYKYTYSVDGWNGYEIPLLEEADNGSLGLIKGTYGVGSSNNTLVDISGGAILNIYVKDSTNTFRNIREYLNTNASNIANIINGTTSVGMALRAVADKLGHDITDTYLTINAGVTKQQLKDYALPREFNDVNFFTADGYSGQLPTGSSPIHTLTTSAVGDFEIFNAVKTLSNVSFQLSNKNSYTDTLFISASANCSVQFRLTTDIYVNDSWETANVELTDEIQMVASQIKKFTFASSMNALSGVFSLSDGNKIRQTLEVVTETSSSITFNVYSNDVYPSTFYLNTTSQTIVLTQGALGELPVYSIVGAGNTSKITFTFPTDSYIADNVEALFDLQYSGAKNESTQLELSYNSQTIQIIVPLNDGTNNPATVRTMMSKYSQNNNRWVFTGVFKVSSGNISVIADVDNLEFDLIGNPNLLINGDFKINQRNFTTLTQHKDTSQNGYDHWELPAHNSVGTTWTATSNGLQITTTAVGQFILRQWITDFNSLKGKTITISIKFKNNTMGFYLYCHDGVSGFTTPYTEKSSGIFTKTLTLSENATQFYVALTASTITGSVLIEWAKLEIGETATPFIPRTYEEELALCQMPFSNNKNLSTTFSNSNILINGDFQINQRGLTSYPTGSTAVYSVDRWKKQPSVNLSAINKNSISLTFTRQYGLFEQYVEDFEKFKGKTLTLSCKISNLNVGGGDGIYLRRSTGDTVTSTKITTNGIISHTFTLSNDITELRLQIFTGTNSSNYSLNLEYMKLEIGSVATPFSPRPYAEELAMCQRYFLKLSSSGSGNRVIGTTFAFSGSSVGAFIPCNLRTSPTLTFEDIQVRSGSLNGVAVETATIDGWSSNFVQINCTTSGATTGESGLLRTRYSTSYVALDAEIY